MMRLLPPAAPAWEPTENCTDTEMEINEQRLSEEGESLIRLEMDCNNTSVCECLKLGITGV